MPSAAPSSAPQRLLCAFALLSAHAAVTHAAITKVSSIQKIYPKGTTPCPEAPGLECKHDSHCVEGEAEIDPKHAHLNLRTSLFGYHCDCPDGFLGHDCGIRARANDCDDEDDDGADDVLDEEGNSLAHTCYHGSECRENAAYEAREEMSLQYLMGRHAYCDCDAANKEKAGLSQKFVGLMCEHGATMHCASTELGTKHSPDGQFCANQGQCKEIVTSEESHPGCRCRPGWTGDHCELKDEDFLTLKKARDDERRKSTTASVTGKILFSILLVAVVGTVVGMTVIVYKRSQGREVSEATTGAPAEDGLDVVEDHPSFEIENDEAKVTQIV